MRVAIFFKLLILLYIAACNRNPVSHTLSLSDSLIAFYPFNGNAGDSSGNNHHGNLSGPALANDKDNRPSQAYNFNGISDLIELENIIAGPTATIAAWFKIDSISNYALIISNLHNLNRLINTSYEINITPNSTLVAEVGSAPNIRALYSSKVLCPHRWYHVALVVDNLQKMSLFIDGAEDTSMNIKALPYIPNDRHWCIGARPDGNYGPDLYFDGSIDEIRIYNRLLSAEEIGALAFYPDNIPPVITLLGHENDTIPQGSLYRDPGASTTDNRECIISSRIVTTTDVDTEVPGNYTVKYNVTDSSGNAAVQVTRKVIVSRRRPG